MRISLLTTETLIAEWFTERYPEVVVCTEANNEFWEAECMIITAFYEIGEDYVQIMDLWEPFMKIRQARKKLIVLGWSAFRSPNYLQVGNMPELTPTWARGVKRAGAKGDQKPIYPTLPDRDIVVAMGRFLHSHGERPFQKLLSKAQTYLRKIERAIREEEAQAYIQAMPEMKEADELLTRAKAVWEERYGYFSLMPQYLDLKKFEDIWEGWERVRDNCEALQPKLSMQISQYINKTIIDIVRFYNIERQK